MQSLKLIRILIVLLIAFGPGIAFGCPDQQHWKDFSTISLTAKNPGLLTLRRFTDGVYARIEGEKEPKEMYQLNGGLYLYRGIAASEQKGPSPFFMLDMPIGMAIGYLAEHFKYPCLIESAQTSFEYVRPFGKSTIKVRGSAHRTSESTITFDLISVEQQESGAMIKMSGTIEFSVITPVPQDMSLSNWVISRDTGFINQATIIKVPQGVKTISDLKRLEQEEAKK